MSILIKNIKMPTNCFDCKVRFVTGCCGCLPHNTRFPNCPLHEFPSDDVVEHKRGKWVNNGDEDRPYIKCSMCGQRKPILLGSFNFNFCPNCGADMRESEGEDG